MFNSYRNIMNIQKYYPRRVLNLHSDGCSKYFRIDLVRQSATTSDTSQHNPFAERINRTIIDHVRASLEESGLGAKYLPFAVEHVVYSKNRVPHSVLRCPPYELLTLKNPSLYQVRVFGCAAFVYNHCAKSKLHGKAVPAIHLCGKELMVPIVECVSARKLCTRCTWHFMGHCFLHYSWPIQDQVVLCLNSKSITVPALYFSVRMLMLRSRGGMAALIMLSETTKTTMTAGEIILKVLQTLTLKHLKMQILYPTDRKELWENHNTLGIRPVWTYLFLLQLQIPQQFLKQWVLLQKKFYFES